MARRDPARAAARAAAPWLGWGLAMGLLTWGLVGRRETLDQVHVVLPFLLLVLGASATAGRRIGVALAVLGFALLDYYFQPPYNRFGAHKPLDLMVLLAFLVTALVATQLFELARGEAETARRRAAEVERLAALGAETLSAGTATAAVGAVAAAIADELGAARAEVWARVAADADGDAAALRLLAAAGGPAGPPPAAGPDAPAPGADAGAAGGRSEDDEDDAADPPRAERLLPLRVHAGPVGVLRLVHARPVALDAPRRALLGALAHYAALAAERVRLVAEAERAAALREADRLKHTVLASVSHDLRTPITTIKVLAHAAARGGDPRAAVIEEQADRLARMVGDLLDLSRARAGGLPLAPEYNTAEDLVGAAARQLAGVRGAERLACRVEEDGGEEPLAGRFDFVAALRALANLAENALKYAPAGPVELVARAEPPNESSDGPGPGRGPGRVLFEVRDRGPGVAEAERGRVFDIFHRADHLPPDVGGAGLGLAVARALAEAQGGEVTYAPRPGGGSVFTLALPRAHAGAAAEPDDAAAAEIFAEP